MKSVAKVNGSGMPTIFLPGVTPPGQILHFSFWLARSANTRCEGLTRRGTRCRARACMIVTRHTDGKQEAQHNACKMHKDTWRWW